MQNLVQEVPDDTYEQIYAVDYGRLTTILWGVCKNLIKRIEILENKSIKKKNYLINQPLFVDQILYKTYH